MKTNRLLIHCAGLLAVALFGACSGGNIDVDFQGPEFPPVPAFPSSEPIIAHGEITGLGGVTINGVSYQTISTAVTVNGEPATLADLHQGQVVTVTGTINSDERSGTADAIRFDANVIGPVENVDAANQQLIVMGQPVTTDSNTRFGAGIDPATYAGLTVGSKAEISGYPRDDGSIRATRIDFAAAAAEPQVTGRALQLDLANLLFRINRLTVDYSSALLIDLPGGAPDNGMRVRAIGDMSGGLFRVVRLIAAPALDGASGERVQTAGFVTRFNSAADFDINEWAAGTDAGTAFINGDDGDLGLHTELTLDGKFAAGGRILANRITLGHVASQAATLLYDFRDFTEISVPTVFNVNVTRGSDFSVEVFVDQGHQHRIDVTQSGSRLNIALLSGNGRIETLDAVITMPVLNSIDLSGVVFATLHDFDQSQMAINVGGVSFLRGNALTIDNVTANVSGVSRLDLGDIRPIGNANIDVSGVSQATLNMDVGSTLAGAVRTGQGTGLSTLFYYGTSVNVSVAKDSSLSVVRLGDTRP